MLDKKKLGVRSPWQFPFNFEHFRELYYEKGNQTDMVTNGHSKKVVQGRVFNGTVHLFGTKGQAQKLAMEWDTRLDNHYFFPMISCLRMSFSVLEHYFSVLEGIFPVFCFFGERDFVPGFLLMHLSRDNGTSLPLETLFQGKGGLISD